MVCPPLPVSAGAAASPISTFTKPLADPPQILRPWCGDKPMKIWGNSPENSVMQQQGVDLRADVSPPFLCSHFNLRNLFHSPKTQQPHNPTRATSTRKTAPVSFPGTVEVPVELPWPRASPLCHSTPWERPEPRPVPALPGSCIPQITWISLELILGAWQGEDEPCRNLQPGEKPKDQILI